MKEPELPPTDELEFLAKEGKRMEAAIQADPTMFEDIVEGLRTQSLLGRYEAGFLVAMLGAALAIINDLDGNPIDHVAIKGAQPLDPGVERMQRTHMYWVVVFKALPKVLVRAHAEAITRELRQKGVAVVASVVGLAH